MVVQNQDGHFNSVQYTIENIAPVKGELNTVCKCCVIIAGCMACKFEEIQSFGEVPSNTRSTPPVNSFNSDRSQIRVYRWSVLRG